MRMLALFVALVFASAACALESEENPVSAVVPEELPETAIDFATHLPQNIDAEVKAVALAFRRQYGLEVEQTKGWQEMMRSHHQQFGGGTRDPRIAKEQVLYFLAGGKNYGQNCWNHCHAEMTRGEEQLQTSSNADGNGGRALLMKTTEVMEDLDQGGWGPGKAGFCKWCGKGACCRHNFGDNKEECKGEGYVGWHGCTPAGGNYQTTNKAKGRWKHMYRKLKDHIHGKKKMCAFFLMVGLASCGMVASGACSDVFKKIECGWGKSPAQKEKDLQKALKIAFKILRV